MSTFNHNEVIEILQTPPSRVVLQCDENLVQLYTIAGKKSIQIQVNNFIVSNSPYITDKVKRYGRKLKDGKTSGVFYSPNSALNHIVAISKNIKLHSYSKGALQ